MYLEKPELGSCLVKAYHYTMFVLQTKSDLLHPVPGIIGEHSIKLLNETSEDIASLRPGILF